MEETNEALSKIARGAGIFSIGLIASKALGYIYRFIIARIGIEQYGLLSLVLSVFGILGTISLLGMGEGIIRFISFYKGKLDQRRIKGVITSSLKICLSLSLLSSFVLFFLSDWIAITFFKNIQLSILFKIFAFALPFDVTRSVFINTITAFQKVEYEVYAKILTENVTKIILTLLAVYLGFGVMGAAIAYILSVILSCVLSFYFLEKKIFPIINTAIVSIKSNKSLLLYSLPLLLTSFVFLAIQWTDTLMLGMFRTITEVGIYNVVLPTAFLLDIFPIAVRTLFFPVLSELYAKNKEEAFKSVYRTVVKWIIIVDAILFVFLVIFSKQIISVLFGNDYVAETTSFRGISIATSSLALIILASGIMFPIFVMPSKIILLIIKKTKLLFFNTVITAIGLNILLNYFLIPKYGIIGAAIATAISHSVGAGLFISIETYYFTKINPFKSSCLKVLSSAICLLVLMIFLKFYFITNIVYIGVIVLISSLVYFVLLLFTKSFEKEDYDIFCTVQQKLGFKLGLDKIIRKFI